MIFLIVFSVILLIVLGILFIPVVVDLEYTDDFKCKVSFLKISLYNSEKNEKPKNTKSEKKSPKKEKETSSVLKKAKTYFTDIKEKKGFSSAVKEVLALVKDILSKIKWLLKFIYINKVKLNIVVGTPDAALTAIEYGGVCSAVYPITALLESRAHIGFKEINVSSDFENEKSSFRFKAKVKMQIFYLLICAFKIYRTIKKFIMENIENE